ncbi:NAD-binding protein [Halosegnis sp.]|uniref:NAD-binding protein n=1 Tax=Halosegnis sp. TaxID=2864959 RepID=UPI0035D44850
MTDTQEGVDDTTLQEVFYPDSRIPLVEWREFSGGKPTVLLTGIATMLAFIAGLSNLSQTVIPLDGPLASVLPEAAAFARFGGVLFAFALGPVVVGLRRRKRLAWQAAVVLVPALALLPLTTFAATDVPLLAAVVATTPLLVYNRTAFDQPIDLSPLQIAALSAIVGVVLYGTMGAYGLRTQFLGLNTWGDAVYYVIVTVATVGYGDITPTTPVARWFSLSIILFGTGAFTVSVGALIGPAIESRMAAAFGNMTASELTLLEDHVAVLGYDDLTEPLLDQLDDDTERVVVTSDSDTAAALESEGINVLTGDPTNESVLRDARVGTARGVAVGSGDDAQDILTVLAVRNVAPDVRVVAAATDLQHVEKFREVGADEVINLRAVGGRLLGESVLADETPDESPPEEDPTPDEGGE